MGRKVTTESETHRKVPIFGSAYDKKTYSAKVVDTNTGKVGSSGRGYSSEASAISKAVRDLNSKSK